MRKPRVSVTSACQLPRVPFPKLSALPRLCRGDASPSTPASRQGGGRVPRGSQEREGRTNQASRRHHPSPLTDDNAQVLEAGQRVLLGVQHLLGRLLHVSVRLLGEHPASATADSGPLPEAPSGGNGRGETSVSSSFTPQPCGPRRGRLLPDPGQCRHLHPPRAPAVKHLRLRLQYGGSPLPALHGAKETQAGRPPSPPPPRPPLAATGRGPVPRTRSRGGGALGGSGTTPLSLRPP